MLEKSEKERLRKVISEAVLLLCKNSCLGETLPSFSVEGIIGITFDEDDVVLLSFKEESRHSSRTSSVVRSAEVTLSGDTESQNEVASTKQPIRAGLETPTSFVITSVDEVNASSAESSCEDISRKEKRKRSEICCSSESKKCKTTKDTKDSDSVSDLTNCEELSLNTDIQLKSESCDDTAGPTSCMALKASSDDRTFTKQRIGTLFDQAAICNTNRRSEIEVNPLNVTGGDAALRSDMEVVPSPNILGSDSVVKCEDDSMDDSCIFVKSEIFDLGDNVLDFACDELSQNVASDVGPVDRDAFLQNIPLSYSQSYTCNVDSRRHRSNLHSFEQLPSPKSRFTDYVTSGYVTQAFSADQVAPSSEDSGPCLPGPGRHDDPIECHICKTVLKCRQTLNDHIQGTHLSRYRYTCLHCGLSFKWRSMLSNHKKSKSCFSSQPPAGYKTN